jgi:hypothetical protein
MLRNAEFRGPSGSRSIATSTIYWSLFSCPHPASRKLGSFSCSISAWFVLSRNIPEINTKSRLALFGAFLSPPVPFLQDSRTTIHSPLTSPPTFHAPRSSGSAPAGRDGYSTPHPAGVNMLRNATFRVFGRSLARLVFGATQYGNWTYVHFSLDSRRTRL